MRATSQDLEARVDAIGEIFTRQEAISSSVRDSAKNIAHLSRENAVAVTDAAQASGKLTTLASNLDGLIEQFTHSEIRNFKSEYLRGRTAEA